jgi:hypothetical protein
MPTSGAARARRGASETYYIGRGLSNDDADFRVVAIAGGYIDRRDDLRGLEEISTTARRAHERVAKNHTADAIHQSAQRRGDRNIWQQFGDEVCLLNDVDERLAAMIYKDRNGRSIHKTQVSVSYRLAAQGVPDHVIIEKILRATMALPEAMRLNWSERRERRGIENKCRSARRKLRELEEMQTALQAMTARQPDNKPPVSLEDFRVRQRAHLVSVLQG